MYCTCIIRILTQVYETSVASAPDLPIAASSRTPSPSLLHRCEVVSALISPGPRGGGTFVQLASACEQFAAVPAHCWRESCSAAGRSSFVLNGDGSTSLYTSGKADKSSETLAATPITCDTRLMRCRQQSRTASSQPVQVSPHTRIAQPLGRPGFASVFAMHCTLSYRGLQHLAYKEPQAQASSEASANLSTNSQEQNA